MCVIYYIRIGTQGEYIVKGVWWGMGNCAVIFIHTQPHKNKTQFTAERCSHRRTHSTYTRAHDCGAYSKH